MACIFCRAGGITAFSVKKIAEPVSAECPVGNGYLLSVCFAQLIKISFIPRALSLGGYRRGLRNNCAPLINLCVTDNDYPFSVERYGVNCRFGRFGFRFCGCVLSCAVR